MPDTPTDQPTPRKRGDGFPGRTGWNQVHDRFRRQVARLARDPETAEKAGRIVDRATAMLTALTVEAAKDEADAEQERARLARRSRDLRRQINRLGRAGRPVGPGLAALVDPPEAPRERP